MTKNKFYKALFDSCDFSNLPQWSVSSNALRKNLGDHTYNQWVKKLGGVFEFNDFVTAVVDNALKNLTAKEIDDLQKFAKQKV